jgi:iron complex transport system permease protein
VLLALLVGAALALSGCVMQGLFRNPLADPGLLGISSGAALAVACWLVLPLSVPRSWRCMPRCWRRLSAAWR